MDNTVVWEHGNPDARQDAELPQPHFTGYWYQGELRVFSNAETNWLNLDFNWRWWNVM